MNRLKIVCTADFHVHPYRPSSRDGGHDRLLDGLSCLRQSLDLAKANRAPWVFCGDFKQPKTSWPQQALTGVHEILREFRDVEKVMIAGNHDAFGIGGSGLAPFKDVSRVVEEVEVVEIGGVEFLCCPWNGDPSAVAALSGKHGGSLPLLAHGFLAGCMLGPEDTRIAKGTPVGDYGGFPFAVFGDVHNGQWRRPGDVARGTPPTWIAYPDDVEVGYAATVKEAAPVGSMMWSGEVFYCGSPYQQNWGERGAPRGALVVGVDSGLVEFHPLLSPKYVHLEIDTVEGLEVFVKDRVRHAPDFVRVVYSGPPSMVVGAAERLGGEFRSYQFIVRREEKSSTRVDIHAGLSTREMLERYVAAKPLPGIDPAMVLEAGLRLAAAADSDA